MISKSEEVISFIKDFGDITERQIVKSQPGWFKELRLKNYDRLNSLGIPTTRDEEWKYTSLSALVKEQFEFTQENEFTPTREFDQYTKGDVLTMVFVNGNYSAKLSKLDQLPKGLKIQTIGDALLSKNEVIEKALKMFEQKDEKKPFVALNKYFTQDGFVIFVEDKAVVNELIHIVMITDSLKQIVSCPRNLIVMGKSSQATVLESHISFNDKAVYFNNPLTEVYVSENAHLVYCKAQKESLKAFHIATTRVIQERNSTFNGFNMTVGAALTRNDLDIDLNGEGSNGILNGLYSVLGTQHVDNHTCVDHKQPNCTSNQLYKGILNGSSRAVFNGKIFVRPIAQKTNSYQLNKNLILGKDAFVDTKPQLEIGADDVKCTHGATIGQLNDEEMFYLQSRCIPKKQAIKMLAVGFIDDVLDHVPDKNITEKLHILLEPSLASI